MITHVWVCISREDKLQSIMRIMEGVLYDNSDGSEFDIWGVDNVMESLHAIHE